MPTKSRLYRLEGIVLNRRNHGEADRIVKLLTSERSVDLLAPEGYGEITGGSERMSDPDKLLAAIHAHDLPEEAYDWYLDLRRYGSTVHSGFGLGVERTVAWICGLDHVRETIAFPRTLTNMRP